MVNAARVMWLTKAFAFARRCQRPKLLAQSRCSGKITHLIAHAPKAQSAFRSGPYSGAFGKGPLNCKSLFELLG